jgi:hypothetical protein
MLSTVLHVFSEMVCTNQPNLIFCWLPHQERLDLDCSHHPSKHLCTAHVDAYHSDPSKLDNPLYCPFGTNRGRELGNPIYHHLPVVFQG